MFDSKKSLIHFIVSGKDLVNSINRMNENESGFATYLTTNGWIVGKEFELNTFDLSKDNLNEEMKLALEDEKGIDAISIAVSMLVRAQKEYKDNESAEIKDSTRAIYLSDVSIKGTDGKIVNSNIFVLFHDQIIGMIPGKIDISQL